MVIGYLAIFLSVILVVAITAKFLSNYRTWAELRIEAIRVGIVKELNEIQLNIKTMENDIQVLYAQVAAVRGDTVQLQSDREGLTMQVRRLAADAAILERRVVAGKVRLGE